ncbi:MAG: serine hydrolase [Paracoccaceae bacterium]
MTRSYRNSDPRPPIMQGSSPPPEWRVPRDSWDRPPWNRWSFRNVRQILPTAPVRRGHDGMRPLASDPQDISAIAFEAADGAAMTVEDTLDATYTDGFLVMLDGKAIHESYHNGMRPESLHLAQSVSKSVVGTVAGILIGRGLLDPLAPVTDYLPELAATGWAGARLRHVLDMTTGVKYDETYTKPDSDMGKTDVAAGWKRAPEGADWPGCIWDQILSLTERDAEHGERFLYRSIETDVLAHAMERVTGTRLAELVSAELWQKLGAEEDACFTVDSAGYALADGGFNASLRDFARFGLMHLNGGRVGDTQVVPRAWIDDIRAGDHGLFDDDHRDRFPNGRYRNQFWIEDAGRQTAMCLGVFGQMIYVSPEWNMVAVKLSTWPDFLDETHMANTLGALHAIARSFGRT